mgnify:CR=1 FL=1
MKNKEEIKQKIFELLTGLSVREAKIFLSEVICSLDDVTLAILKQ